MLLRFSLYGFLKNLRFFEPFLILFFRQKGLSFFQIGLLISYREVCINLFEIPSGAVADIWGRRRSMMLSFTAYIASFALFALAAGWPLLLGAMTLFAVGEAFRTGTHKAMIFDYLKREGRLAEKTKFYGYTRSWSKAGTAVSVVIAAVVVCMTVDKGQPNYAAVFWATIVPYCLDLVNFFTYPSYLDARAAERLTLGQVFRHLVDSFRTCIEAPRLRRLLAETMTYEGLFNTTKDYVQPLVKQWVLLLPFAAGLAAARRTAVLMGAVYFALALAGSLGARHAHRFAKVCGGEDRAARRSWVLTLAAYALLLPSLHWQALFPVAVAAFLGLHLIQNIFRPVQLSRYDAFAGDEKGATILSIESQGKSLATLVLAPLVGWGVDRFDLAAVAWAGLAVVSVRLILGMVRRPR